MAEKPEIFCCDFCGRDTTAQYKICARCLNDKHGRNANEHIGRKTRNLVGLVDKEPDDKDTADYLYHGDNYGDD